MYSTTQVDKEQHGAAAEKGDDVVTGEGLGSVSFTPKWIEKAGVANNETVSGTGAFDPHNQHHHLDHHGQPDGGVAERRGTSPTH
jgi:hypothetical protein